MAVGTIKLALQDWVSDSWVAKTGQSLSYAPTVTGNSLATGYSYSNLLNYKREAVWRSASVASSGDCYFQLDFSATALSSGQTYNAIALWMPACSSANSGTGLSGYKTSSNAIEFYSNTVSGFGGATLLGALTNADLVAGWGTSYSAVFQSRVLLITGIAANNVFGTDDFILVKFYNNATSSSYFEVCKIALLNFQTMSDVVGEPMYTFENRNVYGLSASGSTTVFERDFRRAVSLDNDYISSSLYASIVGQGKNFSGQEKSIMWLSMDYDGAIETGGEHLHTFPAVIDASLEFQMRNQFSLSRFGAMGKIPLHEFL